MSPKFSFLLVFIILTTLKLTNSDAQVIIKGQITDTIGKPIDGATISLLDSATSRILNYTNSNSTGFYKLALDVNQHHYKILANYVGFSKLIVAFNLNQSIYDFKLTESVLNLPEIKIKDFRPYLKVSGDTVSYRVKDFSSPQDKVIGDVLKKLPGIDIDKSGKISYNGKAITNLYIDGDNVLDDKYTIGTNTIPFGLIDQIQVLEHDQPIRVLANTVITDKVSLNLTLKPESKTKLFGQADLSLGVPQIFDVNSNALLLKNQFKSINLFGANNDGVDISTQLLSHNSNDYSQTLDNYIVPQFLSAGGIQYPDALNKRNYYFNSSAIINTNELMKFKDSVQIKLKFYFLDNQQQQFYFNETTVLLAKDNVNYFEKQSNTIKPFTFHGDINININRSSFYLNNTLKLETNNQNQYSHLVGNSNNLYQILTNRLTNLSNDFNFIKSYHKNQVFEIYSHVAYNNQISNLNIDTTLYPRLFNSIGYRDIDQSVYLNTFFSNNNVNYRVNRQYLKQNYSVGLTTQLQQLNSNLYAVGINNATLGVADSGINQLQWTKIKVYLQAKYSIPINIFRFDLTLPISQQHINYYNSFPVYNTYNLDGLMFEPEVLARVNTGVENYVTFVYSRKTNTGNIDNLYSNYILTDYRTINSNSPLLPQTKTQTFSIDFNYRKAIQIFFFHIGMLFREDATNLISYNELNNEVTFLNEIPFDNRSKNFQLFSGISKYIFILKTAVSFKVNWQYSRINQFYNNTFLPYSNYSYSLIGNINSKTSDRAFFNYYVDFNYLISHPTTQGQQTKTNETFYYLNQKIEFNYNISGPLFIKVEMEYLNNHNTETNLAQYIFLNSTIDYRLKKWNTDFQLSGFNIADVRDYKTTLLQSNILERNDFKLRGRLASFKITFNF